MDTFRTSYEAGVRPFIRTFSGKVMYFDDPGPSIAIEDIANGLANNCRWSGQCKGFYSIAQHSVLVSKVIAPNYALYGLLHDASEAYTGDVSHPLKKMIGDLFRPIENKIEAAVWKRYGLEQPNQVVQEHIKDADMSVALAEARVLMDMEMTYKNVRPAKVDLTHQWDHRDAKIMFMNRFQELM